MLFVFLHLCLFHGLGRLGRLPMTVASMLLLADLVAPMSETSYDLHWIE